MEKFLLKQYKELLSAKFIDVYLINEQLDNWCVDFGVQLLNPDNNLFKSLRRKKIYSIKFMIKFPKNYPDYPPFIYLKFPSINSLPKGAFCTEILLPQGWIPEISIETLLIQLSLPLNTGRVDGLDNDEDDAKNLFETFAKIHKNDIFTY